MAESCSLKAHCRNSKGEVVESKLFNDLLHYTSNDRSLTKEYYSVGTNEKFLSQVEDKAKFDENGEITFNSLRKLAKINIAKDKILQTLNKDIKSGVYDYKDAMYKLQSFNRNSQFNEDYMATIESTNDGKYKLSIVERNVTNELKLNDEISNMSLQDRIKYYLNKAGVGIEFIENDERINGRYSTKNAKKTADGLYQLIQISKGNEVTESMAEEAGHFAIGALGNSPLVERLLNIMTPEVQKEIIGEDYKSKYMGDSAKREVAGTLVGRAIAGHIDERAPWQFLINRIINKAKRMFYKMSGNDIANAALESKEIAEQIARGFMSPEFTGNVQSALKTKETLFSATDSSNVKLFKETANRLRLQALEMKNISNDLFDKFNRIAGQVESGRNVSAPSAMADAIALDGITEALVLMSDLMVEEIPSLLASVDFSSPTDFMLNIPRNAKSLRVVRTFVQNANALIKLVNESNSPDSTDKLVGDKTNVILVDALGNRVSKNLLDIIEKFSAQINGTKGIANDLRNKEAQFFLRFLQETHGGPFIERAARVVFKWKGGEKFLAFKEKETQVIDVKNLDSDITIFEKFLSSMSNNSDIVGQLVDKVVKLANKWADDLTYNDQNQLRILKSQLKEETGLTNTDKFCEISPRTGKLTGNIISPVCWGDYEDDWMKFKEKCKKEFFEANPNLEGKSDFEKALLWNEFFKPRAKLWHLGDPAIDDEEHMAHSQWNKELNMWVPSNLDVELTHGARSKNYSNEQYEKLSDSEKKWLNKFMVFKKSVNDRLPEGSAPLHRMPQFKGTFSNRIRNRKLLESGGKATIHTIKQSMAETFCEDSEDTEFGSEQTYNTIEEDMFSDKLSFEEDKLNRIPMYGINKLRDTSQISTDLFYSMFAFAGMTNNFAAMSQIVDTLEVGKDVLAKRKVEGLKDESETNGDKSKAYNRYLKFLDKQVYGIGVPKIKIGKKIVVNKIANFLTGLASKFFLGGNVPGGLVNVGTGSIEIFKEALAGEYFTLNDWKRANRLYFESLPKNWMSTGKDIKEDKVSLMMRHFNILSNSRQKQRDWHTRDSRLTNFFGDSLFLPYKSGDHYMQVISYLSLAQSTKVYDKDGHKISLFNAYEVDTLEDNNDKKDKSYGKDLVLKGTFFKTKECIDEYNMIQSILTQVNESISNPSPFGSILNLSSEELKYLSDNNINIADLNDVSILLQDRANKLVWTVDDESAFMDKAREINNRMHGIYNNQDKVALQQHIFFNMVLAMRGYALGMMERRFGASKYSEALGGETEGSMRTLAKVILSTFTDRGKFSGTMGAILLPWSDKTKQYMLQTGFSANQYYNMRRNWGDMMFIAALAILKYLVLAPDDDDDEEDDIAMGLGYYFSSRLLREQYAFNTIPGMYSEYKTLGTLTPVGFSALWEIGETSLLLLGAPFADEDNSTFFYQQDSSPIGAYEYHDSKGWIKLWRKIPYIRSEYVFNQPYKAAESFDFGKDIKN